MVNILVADDNLYYAKTLVNYIMSKNDKIRVVNISTNGQEVMENLKSGKIDILILDLKMPVLSGIQILDKIQVLNLDISIIVVSGEEKLIKHIINNKMVEGFINKLAGLEKINQKINEIITRKDNRANLELIKKRILEELLFLGYNIKYNGTKYLAEVIYLIYEMEGTDNINGRAINLEQYFYKILANKYSKSVKNIKINIINATESMYMECERETLQNYFSFSYDHKPTPKVVIDTVISKII